MRTAITGGRKTRPTIKLGICGEHGGDPSSVEFCHQLGLDYVSCSPYRVGIARLAAAQAALAQEETEKAKPKKVQPSSKRVAKSKPVKKAATPAPAKKRPAAKRAVRRPKRTKR
jgi:pyruvate,orthophosphate dikinase